MGRSSAAAGKGRSYYEVLDSHYHGAFVLPGWASDCTWKPGRAKSKSISGKGYKPNEVTVKAKIRRNPLPRYTEEARQHQISGIVVLEMVLRATGEVTDITVIEGLPYGLNENSINTAKEIKFDPALKDDQKVSQYLRVVYEFHLY